jgi:FkbM family methyltransferase
MILFWIRILNKVLPLEHRYMPILKKIFLKNDYWSFCKTEEFRVYFKTKHIDNFSNLLLYGINRFIEFQVVKDSINSFQNGLIFDIGANAGYWSMLCGRNSKIMVEAFEPDPNTFEVLEKNRTENSCKNIISHRLALGDRQGTLLFKSGLNGYIVSSKLNKTRSQEDDIIEVPVETIDKLNRPKIDFIKIDVEGFEGKVLEGAIQTIRKDKPKLLVELHPYFMREEGNDSKKVYYFLKKYYSDIKIFTEIPTRNKALRFLKRYKQTCNIKFYEEEEFLESIKSNEIPSQVYVFCQ